MFKTSKTFKKCAALIVLVGLTSFVAGGLLVGHLMTEDIGFTGWDPEDFK